ncbi:hypothetical protein WHU29_21555 [Escherichia coli]
MQPQLHQEITRRLLADFSFKEQGDWLRQGICPDCQKKSCTPMPSARGYCAAVA